MMKKEHIEPFFATLKAANPQPNTELEYTSVFELLAAVLLSAQATDVGVNKATRRLFPVANTPQAILHLGLPKLESYIQTIGLFRSKAKHLMQTCEILVSQHGGEVPRTREALGPLGFKVRHLLGHALLQRRKASVRVQVRVVQGQEAGWTTELRGVRTSQATTYEPTMPPRPAATTPRFVERSSRRSRRLLPRPPGR